MKKSLRRVILNFLKTLKIQKKIFFLPSREGFFTKPLSRSARKSSSNNMVGSKERVCKWVEVRWNEASLYQHVIKFSINFSLYLLTPSARSLPRVVFFSFDALFTAFPLFCFSFSLSFFFVSHIRINFTIFSVLCLLN